MWDGLGGMGAGEAAEPVSDLYDGLGTRTHDGHLHHHRDTVSAADALVYGRFSVVWVAAGAINNRTGLQYGLALGTIGGFPLYGAGLYTSNVHPTTWFMLFGTGICGISAGFFWAAEATVIVGYPHPPERAFYLAVCQTAKAAGPIVGGAINLGLNAGRSTAGSVGSTTYIVFIAIMRLGLPSP
ncbi:uncharacterized protein L3040_007154 [Drepanopeziza brunnea f. sp. 'multigermtubi']|uniref:Uncharacterized protein n=1 Tax=Marssonina brunnea f. sp. multigermtubi (strain MB_m1) TaxID=1072389 RepID=K1WLF2_MARBU|nr:uncharacterized protein MBM_08834 [Drepanopeziza brunnea f. sp. 'multigermtubi' MB_m1]EKD13072.1 hypothetical protein MBM_08834 [Drepanopeziza brunnea f. sp. 'multigermtubi' MB_m1]KAJ5038287.1 hypothetical protein L3040_007154 [Drepanopeziza brunnea f. sp. 'multigermtubi']